MPVTNQDGSNTISRGHKRRSLSDDPMVSLGTFEKKEKKLKGKKEIPVITMVRILGGK